MENLHSPEFENLSIEQKEEIVSKKKRAFIKKMALLIVVLAGLIALTVFGLKIRKELIQDRVRFVTNPPEETPEVITPVIEPETEKEYSNTTLQVSLKYPADATLKETFDSEKGEGKVEISFSKDNNLEFLEGYKVGITVFSTQVRDLFSFASTRLEAMRTSCPTSASISKLDEGTMDEYGSLNFQIDYCDGYYRNYYTEFGGKFFEISRYYKGDVGFRQQYETITEEIIKSINLMPQRFEPSEFLRTGSDQKSRISFEYPSYLVNDCTVALPTDSKYRVILSMCLSDKKDAGVILAVPEAARGIEFESWYTTEKNKLSDDFFAAKGYPPKGTEEKIEFNGEQAYRLSGYSWKETDYIFVNTVGEKDAPQTVVIGYKQGSEDFRTTVDNILKSIKFRQ